MIVTTSLRACNADVETALRFTKEGAFTFIARGGLSLQQLQRMAYPSFFVVIEGSAPKIYCGGSGLFFHRGMSGLRILNLIRTGKDPLVQAAGLRPGMTFLDCTLGMAADSLVASFIVGDRGHVLGLEASEPISILTRWGLKAMAEKLRDEEEVLVQAAARIDVLQAEHRLVLSALPARSFDVVYFDPMFRYAKSASTGIQSLRFFADDRALSTESILQACRVARKRVVLKEARNGAEFSRLGFQNFAGGRYSPVQYGVIHTEAIE